MPYKMLYLFIEGDDDERFFQIIIKPILEKYYDSIVLWKYAKETKKKINNFLKSIKAMNNDYLFFTDINHSPCVTATKQGKLSILKHIKPDRIIVVIKEIESWYFAGLNIEGLKILGINHKNIPDITDNLTKEQFNRLIPDKFDSRIDFMQEILKYFSLRTAKQKNKSFGYFLDRFNCKV